MSELDAKIFHGAKEEDFKKYLTKEEFEEVSRCATRESEAYARINLGNANKPKLIGYLVLFLFCSIFFPLFLIAVIAIIIGLVLSSREMKESEAQARQAFAECAVYIAMVVERKRLDTNQET